MSKSLFLVFSLLYMVLPLIAVPVWAAIQQNWWLLFGILISFLGAMFSRIVPLAILGCVWFWIKNGFDIYDTITFFAICAVWGCVISEIADFYKKKAHEDAELAAETQASLKSMGL